MMGRSIRCYIPSFVEIVQPVTVKKIFEGFLPYLGMAAILVMCPASYQQSFISMYLKAYRQNLVKMAKCFLRKACFNFHTKMALGQGQEMTLTFNTHKHS